jgi:enoyl-CoA hydratase/carnithine racemase
MMPASALVAYETRPIPETNAMAAVITLDRPAELNAMSWELIRAFDGAVSSAEADPGVRVILITGRGRAFSAGGDLKSYVELQRDPVRFPAFVKDLHDAFGRLRSLRVPVIALVNGVTVAGGLELLLSCDMAIAATSASIGDGHLNFGQMGGGGVLTLLARMVGIARAAELVMTGRLLDAETAADWGLVSNVVPDAQLMDRGMALASQIAVKSPLAVANAKEVMNTIWAEAMSVSSGLRLERERNAVYCLTSQDAPEGLLAFSEKRATRFQGR